MQVLIVIAVIFLFAQTFFEILAKPISMCEIISGCACCCSLFQQLVNYFNVSSAMGKLRPCVECVWHWQGLCGVCGARLRCWGNVQY